MASSASEMCTSILGEYERLSRNLPISCGDKTIFATSDRNWCNAKGERNSVKWADHSTEWQIRNQRKLHQRYWFFRIWVNGCEWNSVRFHRHATVISMVLSYLYVNRSKSSTKWNQTIRLCFSAKWTNRSDRQFCCCMERKKNVGCTKILILGMMGGGGSRKSHSNIYFFTELILVTCKLRKLPVLELAMLMNCAYGMLEPYHEQLNGIDIDSIRNIYRQSFFSSPFQ